MARTAVIAGTAQAVAGSVAQKQQASARASAAPPPEPTPPPPPMTAPPAAAAPPDLMAQLTKLGDMKTAGLIDEAEFVAAKARLLGI